jgi:hypothetical protein
LGVERFSELSLCFHDPFQIPHCVRDDRERSEDEDEDDDEDEGSGVRADSNPENPENPVARPPWP